jgi:Relaxase/Mobilisation nuclease domain
MIPRIAQRGHSFKGAGLYYLHDKKAMTNERVAWTYTHNLPTNDPDLALQCMAWTDCHSDYLKQASGVGLGGTQTAGNVFAYSLSWHPDQQPDPWDMQQAVRDTLSCLGLSDHQALLVAHDDTDHAHVHVIVNLVHPDTGRVGDLSYSKRKLQEWASEFEREGGEVYCEERERNAERRDRGEVTKYQDEKVADAPAITQLYQQSDSGSAFVAALAEQGYIVARGDKKRLVIVDQDGVVQNLVRQIDGVKKKDIEAKLGALLKQLPSVAQVHERQKTERLEVLRGDADASGQDMLAHPSSPPTPTIQAVHMGTQAVDLGFSVEEAAHRMEVALHLLREQKAAAAEMEQEATPADDRGVVVDRTHPLRSVTQTQAVGVVMDVSESSRHLSKVREHVRRIAAWVREKPREYMESWKAKRRTSASMEQSYDMVHDKDTPHQEAYRYPPALSQDVSQHKEQEQDR